MVKYESSARHVEAEKKKEIPPNGSSTLKTTSLKRWGFGFVRKRNFHKTLGESAGSTSLESTTDKENWVLLPDSGKGSRCADALPEPLDHGVGTLRTALGDSGRGRRRGTDNGSARGGLETGRRRRRWGDWRGARDHDSGYFHGEWGQVSGPPTSWDDQRGTLQSGWDWRKRALDLRLAGRDGDGGCRARTEEGRKRDRSTGGGPGWLLRSELRSGAHSCTNLIERRDACM